MRIRRFWLVLAIFSVFNFLLHSKIIEIGDTLGGHSFKDQLNRDHQLNSNTQMLIAAFDWKGVKEDIQYLKDKPANFLNSQNIEYIMNGENLSSFLKKWYYLPKLKKVPCQLLLANGAPFLSSIPRKEKNLTIIKMGPNRRVIEILFMDGIDDMFSLVTNDPEQIQEGIQMEPYALVDQFHHVHNLQAKTRFVLVAGEMPVAKMINQWLEKKDKDYLERNHIEYIAEISGMPAMITKRFAIPKMQKYPFTILLAKDKKFSHSGPLKPSHFTVLELDAGHLIKQIHYLATPDKLESLLHLG